MSAIDWGRPSEVYSPVLEPGDKNNNCPAYLLPQISKRAGKGGRKAGDPKPINNFVPYSTKEVVEMTRTDAARAYGFNNSTITYWLKKGWIAAKKNGTVWVITNLAMEACIEARKKKAA